jgi:hypothetical protein
MKLILIVTESATFVECRNLKMYAQCQMCSVITADFTTRTGCTLKCVGLCVKQPLKLLHLNENWSNPTVFHKILKYQLSWKCIKCFLAILCRVADVNKKLWKWIRSMIIFPCKIWIMLCLRLILVSTLSQIKVERVV